jgi:hypothetical protein
LQKGPRRWHYGFLLGDGFTGISQLLPADGQRVGPGRFRQQVHNDEKKSAVTAASIILTASTAASKVFGVFMVRPRLLYDHLLVHGPLI